MVRTAASPAKYPRSSRSDSNSGGPASSRHTNHDRVSIPPWANSGRWLSRQRVCAHQPSRLRPRPDQGGCFVTTESSGWVAGVERWRAPSTACLGAQCVRPQPPEFAAAKEHKLDPCTKKHKRKSVKNVPDCRSTTMARVLHSRLVPCLCTRRGGRARSGALTRNNRMSGAVFCEVGSWE